MIKGVLDIFIKILLPLSGASVIEYFYSNGIDRTYLECSCQTLFTLIVCLWMFLWTYLLIKIFGKNKT